MHQDHRLAAFIYRSVAWAITLFGLLSHVGVFRGAINLSLFVYYTIQSNALVLLLFSYLSIRTLIDLIKNGKTGNSTYIPRVKGAITLAIVVTFIVFWVLLAPSMFTMADNQYNLLGLDNNLVHTIVPILAVLDWVLFDKKGYFQKKDPLYWTSIPLVYFLFAIIRAQIGGPLYNGSYYPYFFIDFDALGGVVFLYVIGIYAFFLGLGYFIYWIDQKQANKQQD